MSMEIAFANGWRRNPQEAREVRRCQSFLCVLPHRRSVGRWRAARRPGRAADGRPLAGGRPGAACLGAPFFIPANPDRRGSGDQPLRRLVIAQDTGGAIVGPVRADIYFGAGRRGRQGRRPAAAHHAALSCWCRRASIRSARGRKLPVPDDAAVGEDRKTVSANRSAEGPADRAEDRDVRPPADGESTPPTADAQAAAPAATVPQPRACRCRKPRPNVEPVSQSRGSVSFRRYRYRR